MRFWILLSLIIPVQSNIVVVGSINADTFLPVERFPKEGENIGLIPGELPISDVPGGKGATQAVAAAKLLSSGSVSFVGQLGGDSVADVLLGALHEAKVDTSLSDRHTTIPSGRGYVFLTKSGQVSAIVSGGSNQYGWDGWKEECLDDVLGKAKCVLLQAEIPSLINERVARLAKSKNVLTIQDVGGEDRPIESDHLSNCDYLVPNETELARLVKCFEDFHVDTSDENSIIQGAEILQKYGAHNVLVTLGSRGALLVQESGKILRQGSFSPEQVVDETGAGDCFRSGFAIALSEGLPLQKCLEFACAAGCCSVEKSGAIPSCPSRKAVEDRIRSLHNVEETILKVPRGDGLDIGRGGDAFPFLIGSRLNSMKDRPELWDTELKNPRDFVRRQATVKGLTCVDFNYPQHFQTWSAEEAKHALDETGLVAGAVCLRYPSKFARGAMNHPDASLRREAIEVTKAAAEAALVLGCKEVCVWSAYDGYDYPFTQDYDEAWNQLVVAFQECCDAYPAIRFSVEYKPTDENTRFFTVPSTGAAILLLKDVDRENFGLTLDVGHMLMSGENPGQSIAMVGRLGKLFGIQLNDGFTRLAAEDGLMFGSVHPGMALEIMYQLWRIKFDGHLYFDTFPQRSDPVKEAEYNIKRVKAYWRVASSIDEKKLRKITGSIDSIAALELVDDCMKRL